MKDLIRTERGWVYQGVEYHLPLPVNSGVSFAVACRNLKKPFTWNGSWAAPAPALQPRSEKSVYVPGRSIDASKPPIPPPDIRRTCYVCGQSFRRKGNQQKLCSEECQRLARNARQRKYTALKKGEQC